MKPNYQIYFRPFSKERKRDTKFFMEFSSPNWYKDFDSRQIIMFVNKPKSPQ